MEKPSVSPNTDIPLPLPQPIHGTQPGLGAKPKWYKERKKLILIIAAAIIGVTVIIFASFAVWYTQETKALGKDTNKYVLVDITKGQTPGQIAQTLQQKGVIRSANAFVWYTRLTRTGGSLQFGSYRLTPSDNVSAIIKHLTNGDVDTFQLTFLPGATVADNKAVLIDAGYAQTEVDAAFNASYNEAQNGLVFHDKPVSASLEGYIYGETYQFNTGSTVGTVLQRAFDAYSDTVKKDDLIALYKSHGLSLYEGITLASIIEREMGATDNENVPTTDQEQVAQVFYLRLSQGTPLGSDVTYQYAAKLLGVTPSPTLVSPYNTRINAGLPPGPIATPSQSALLATAHPASGNYVYFLSGDDGKTYFARTNAEHEANIAAHCQVKCSTEQ